MGDDLKSVAIVGGTGSLGGGLGHRLARAGIPVVIGSRSADKAAAMAAEIVAENPEATVRSADNRTAASLAEMVILTVPFSNHATILDQIKDAVRGKIVVDATVPLVPPKVGTVQLPERGAAALIARDVLGEDVQVVAAFHNVAAAKLWEREPIDCDILVCGDKKAAREEVIRLVNRLDERMRGIHAGPLANAAAVEALTSVLITINKTYRASGAGVRITGDLTPPVSSGS